MQIQIACHGSKDRGRKHSKQKGRSRSIGEKGLTLPPSIEMNRDKSLYKEGRGRGRDKSLYKRRGERNSPVTDNCNLTAAEQKLTDSELCSSM
eukprot:g61270.t1